MADHNNKSTAMKKYNLYLFDFDGTLLDTSKCLYYVFNEAFKEAHINIKEDDVELLSRIPITEGYIKMHGKAEYVEAFSKRIKEALNEEDSIKYTKKFPEIDELLDIVKKNNINVGIVTSNDTLHVYKVLEFLNIDPKLFKVIVGSDKCKEIKPSPQPILEALKEANYTGSYDKAIYIGDSFNDCLAGKNAHIDYLLLDRKGNSNSEFPKISNLLELFR